MSEQGKASDNRRDANSPEDLPTGAQAPELELEVIRAEIDRVDSAIVDLVKERFRLIRQVVEIKEERALPTVDLEREKEVIDKVRAKIRDPRTALLVETLYVKLFELSREYQVALRAQASPKERRSPKV
jgi:monofunctional chorismate mutase